MMLLSAGDALRRPFRFPAACALAFGIATCALAAPVPGQAQDDRMTPIAAPAQPDANELGTGALPGATAKESCHGGDINALPSRSGQGVGRSGGRGAGRRVPHAFHGQ